MASKIMRHVVLVVFMFSLLLPGTGTFAAPAEKLGIEGRMLHRRAVEAAIWGMPLVGIRSFLTATRRDLGGDWNDIIYFSKPMVSRHGFLTANNQTPYVVASLSTKRGALVVEIPPATDKAKLFGSFVDIWERPITDVGPKGADRGKGGKYLFLPPGYGGEIPEGYLVFRPCSYAVYVALRPVPGEGASLAEVVAYGKQVRVYPLSQAHYPPPTRYIDAYPHKWDTLPKYDLSFYKLIAEVINEEPVQSRDLAMMGLLASLGIEKGKPFTPDARTRKILTAAVQEAHEYLQWMFEKHSFRKYFPDRQWSVFNLPREQARAGWPFMTRNRMLIDLRANMYHFVTFMPKKPGAAAAVAATLYDADGKPLNGQDTYRLRVPGEMPARDFWSVIAYSFATHGFIKGAKRVGISSLILDQVDRNEDGSVDIYFAPTPPPGHERNWIQTGERFWVGLRLYGPKKLLLVTKHWSIGDLEVVR